MSYSYMLKEMIEQSGLSYKEIADRCKELGKPIDPSYISKLVNNKISPPRDDISTILAKVCNKDETSLILEAYLDKAPRVLIDFINKIKSTTISSALTMFKNGMTSENYELFKQALENTPISSYVIEGNAYDVDMTFQPETVVMDISNNESKINLPITLDVKDDAMAPKIRKGNHIIVEVKDNYSNGDIIVFATKGTNSYIIRKLYIKDDNYILIALNDEYEPLICDRKDIIIMGKVVIIKL